MSLTFHTIVSFDFCFASTLRSRSILYYKTLTTIIIPQVQHKITIIAVSGFDSEQEQWFVCWQLLVPDHRFQRLMIPEVCVSQTCASTGWASMTASLSSRASGEGSRKPCGESSISNESVHSKWGDGSLTATYSYSRAMIFVRLLYCILQERLLVYSRFYRIVCINLLHHTCIDPML